MEKANADPVMGTDRGSKFAPPEKGAEFRRVLNYERVYRIFAVSYTHLTLPTILLV